MPSSTPVVFAANVRRNGRATPDRPARWRGARAELWAVLEPDVLVDLDVLAARRAIARERRSLRSRITAIEVTAGAAERVASAVIAGASVRDAAVPREPIGTGGYDVVIGDLLPTQLLFPALLDAEVDPERRTPALRLHGQRLTDGVVARLRASTPGGHVVHVNDVAGWWPGHPQPLAPEQVPAPEPGPAALLHRLGRPVGWWTWPFDDVTTYVVHAIVARAAH